MATVWPIVIFQRCFRCLRMGPWHWQLLLPMALLGPSYFLVSAANTQEWAHCICSYCCQWHHLGPIIFQEALPIPWNGPISLVAFAANGCTLAHYCFSEILPMP